MQLNDSLSDLQLLPERALIAVFGSLWVGSENVSS